ncbi:type VII secretion protein EssA [Metabacillus litoralis]|uniref:type VII secretion protein EssA n=1 Tax=Metabacillus TaxID=2675233 RepID=UPI001B9A0BF6|nr:type VII secretion protein EssA [Metabacillus litoralis]UHA58413.1 type VII secretion protein EssA [Metabacillus litoralis]
MLIIFLSLALASPVNGSTNIESIEELSPNEYERETDNKDTDLIEGDVLTKEKHQIPEEQKVLTFERKKIFNVDEINSELFKKENQNTNTIIHQAKQLKLFSGPQSIKVVKTEEDSKSSLSLSLLILGFIILCLIMLTIVFVTYGKANNRIENS